VTTHATELACPLACGATTPQRVKRAELIPWIRDAGRVPVERAVIRPRGTDAYVALGSRLNRFRTWADRRASRAPASKSRGPSFMYARHVRAKARRSVADPQREGT